MKISTILDNIDAGQMALPEFQRSQVWNRDQVRGLMDSRYRRHPVGSLLVWAVPDHDETTDAVRSHCRLQLKGLGLRVDRELLTNQTCSRASRRTQCGAERHQHDWNP
jgi:Protein of unknown function DUF262